MWATREVHNYPNGLPEGTYVFPGHRFEPCSHAVEFGDYPGPCPKPNASVEVFTASLTRPVAWVAVAWERTCLPP